MILVQTDEERKANQKKYRTSPGYKASQKKSRTIISHRLLFPTN